LAFTAMNVPRPHFQLYSHASASRTPAHAGSDDSSGEWQFVLKREDGQVEAQAADEEPGTPADRLELLAIVRGLEALDQPSRVTLFTASRYVARGLRFGLEGWRESDWQWERFGQMQPVKNADLWQRIDQAMRFHQVDVRTPRYDALDDLSFVPPAFASAHDAEALDDEMPDFREMSAPLPTLRRSAKPPANSGRPLRVKGREFRIDKGTGTPERTGSPRGEPPPGVMTRLAGVMRRFFGVSS
jgi:ribonuclease HI